MPRLNLVAVLSLSTCVIAATPGTVVVEDSFANGDSQKQDLASNSLCLFNGRASNIRTDQPYTVNAHASTVGAGSPMTADWSAAAGHSAKDWIGLYAEGDPDNSFVSWHYTGAATAGHLVFTAPARAGQYEFRYADGFERAATGNGVVVR